MVHAHQGQAQLDSDFESSLETQNHLNLILRRPRQNSSRTDNKLNMALVGIV
jgi:hypothetical protein